MFGWAQEKIMTLCVCDLLLVQVHKGVKTGAGVLGSIVGGGFGLIGGPAGVVVGATAGATFMNGWMELAHKILH